MNIVSSLASGAVIGVSIAAPVGPMAILCISRTLNAGVKAGISTGAGASTILVGYASVVLLGLQQVAPFLASARPILTVLSAGLMVFFAVRVIYRKPGIKAGTRADSAMWNYLTAIAFNCTNPMLVFLLVGAVGVVIGPDPLPGPMISTTLAGVFLGSLCWWIVFSVIVAALRGRFGAEFVFGINRIAGAGMIGFAALSLGRLAGA